MGQWDRYWRGGEGGPSISRDGTGPGSPGDDGTIEILVNQWGDGGMVAQPRRGWHRFEMKQRVLKCRIRVQINSNKAAKMAVKTKDSAHTRGKEKC